MAEVVAPGVAAPARGPGPPHHRLPGRRRGPLHPPPGVHQRDGGPLRRPRPPPRLEERLRRRRVGSRPDGQLADPGVRLSGRDHLPRRRLRQRARHPRPAGQRHLHPRGGRRHPLEAPGPPHRHHRGPAVPPAGGVVDRHGGQLRVRLLLVLLPRRHHPAGGEADRHRLHPGPGRRGGDPLGDGGGTGPGRPVPPAPVLRPVGPGGGRPGQRGVRGGLRGGAGRSRQPAGQRLPPAGDPPHQRAGGHPGHRRRLQPALAVREPGASERPRPAGGLPPHPRGHPHPAGPPPVQRGTAGGLRPAQPVGHAVGPRRAPGRRGLPQPARRGRGPPAAGRRPTARCSVPTWWPGTPSASPTGPGPRTGR